MRLSSEDYVRMGKLMRRVRTLARYSEEDVAKSIGFKKSNITRWENGHYTKDFPRYANLIYYMGKKYKKVIPMYFEAYIFSPEVQQRLQYYNTKGYFYADARRELGYTIKQAAKMVEWRESTISELENNTQMPLEKEGRYASFIVSEYLSRGMYPCNYILSKANRWRERHGVDQIPYPSTDVR